MRVLVISVGYVLQKTPSDKQFVSDLIGSFSSNVEVFIWSLNDAREGSRVANLGGKSIYYRNRNRILHKPLFVDDPENSNYIPHPCHSNPRNGIEINASLLRYLLDIKRIVNEFRPDILHVTDSLGPAASLIKRLFPLLPITITKPTIRLGSKRKGGVYKYYVKKSLVFADKVIVFTHAASRELVSMGVPEQQVSVIPWGVNPGGANKDNYQLIKKRYGWRPGELFVVVSDRLGERGMGRLVNALDKASQLVNARFVIAVRPTRYLKRYENLSTESVVIEDGPRDFYDLLSAADVMYSPTSNSGAESTSLLPLVWIEAMTRKTPIITKKTPGVEDLIKDGENGLLYETDDQIMPLLERLSKDFQYLQRMQEHAGYWVNEKFTIQSVAQGYQEVWESLVDSSNLAIRT